MPLNPVTTKPPPPLVREGAFIGGTGGTSLARPQARTVVRVNPSTDIRDFLISRRARISPEQAGLPAFGYGGKRRVQGLRREEVAMLSGISVGYYTRLERGKATG